MSETTRRHVNEDGNANRILLIVTAVGTMAISLAGCGQGNASPARATATPNQYVSGQALLNKEQQLDQRLLSGLPMNIREGLTACEYGKGGYIIVINAIDTKVNGQEAVGYISKDGAGTQPHINLLMYNNPGDPTTDLPACQTSSWAGQEPDAAGTIRPVTVSSQDVALSGNYIAFDPTTGQPLLTKFGDDMPVGAVTSDTKDAG